MRNRLWPFRPSRILTDLRRILYAFVLALSVCVFGMASVAQPSAEHDTSIDELQERLGSSFDSYLTEHFHVLSDAQPSRARRLGALLEQTRFQFRQFCRRIGFKPTDVERRHPCILFAERESFVEYAKEYDRVAESWVGGYFSNHGNYTAFYPADRDPSINTARRKIEEWEGQLEDIRAEVRQARMNRDSAEVVRLGEHERALADHLKTQRARLDKIVNGRSESRVIHETVHMLAFNCGLQSRYRVPPFWLTEGLATNFETDRANSAFGPGFEYATRRTSFENAIRSGSAPSLKELLVETDIADVDAEQAELLYSQAYAFFQWVYRFRRDELAELFTHYAAHPQSSDALPAGRLSGKRHLAEFEKVFGQVERVEKAWLRWERSLIRPVAK